MGEISRDEKSESSFDNLRSASNLSLVCSVDFVVLLCLGEDRGVGEREGTRSLRGLLVALGGLRESWRICRVCGSVSCLGAWFPPEDPLEGALCWLPEPTAGTTISRIVSSLRFVSLERGVVLAPSVW